MNVVGQEAYRRYFCGQSEATSNDEVDEVGLQWSVAEDDLCTASVAFVSSRRIPVANRDWVAKDFSKSLTAVLHFQLIDFQSREVVAAQPSNTAEHQELVRIFADHCRKWREETRFCSSSTDLIMHSSYQRIIGLGPNVVPLILDEMAKNGGHWFPALEALTGVNPVNPGDVGRIKRMREAWLKWGQDSGLV